MGLGLVVRLVRCRIGLLDTSNIGFGDGRVGAFVVS